MKLRPHWAMLLMLAACGKGEARPEVPSRGTEDVPAPAPQGPTPAELDTMHRTPAPGNAAATLALQVNDSVAIWYTGSRADTSEAGKPCVERVMEIRRGARTIPIPLLYTGEVPVLF